MGRCQGGFCMPLVTKIISEFEQIPEEKVRKAGIGSEILLRGTKPDLKHVQETVSEEKAQTDLESGLKTENGSFDGGEAAQ